MSASGINSVEMFANTADDDILNASQTIDENSHDSHQNHGPSTPEPTKEQPLRRSNRGKGRSDRGNHGDERIQSCISASVEYRPSDFVYFEDTDFDYYVVGMIDEIKLSRREKCTVVLKYFWRTCDVPDVSKQALLDREAADKGNPRILARELFITDLQTSIDSSLLRGKCNVIQFPELTNALDAFDPSVEDSFYYVYAYSPDSKRLLSIRAEIKIGPAYQATWLPLYRGTFPVTHRCAKHNSVLKRLRETQNTTINTTTSAPHLSSIKSLKRSLCCSETTSHCEHVCLSRVEDSPPRQWEELVWQPERLAASLPPFNDEVGEPNADGDAEGEGDASEFADRRLKTYLDAVRSLVAIFAFGGADDDLISAENGHVIANLVATTQHAYDTLHQCDYDVAKALETIRYKPLVSRDTPQHWTVEQVRRFSVAVRQHGKNFYAIHRDYFSPATAVDPITGEGGATLDPRTLRRRRKRGEITDTVKQEGSNSELPDTEGDNGNGGDDCEDGEEENDEEEEAGERPETDGEDVKDLSQFLFEPTRVKTLKQLITFYYYWKRKNTSSMGSLSSAAAHAASAAAAAANSMANGPPFRGPSVEANFNRSRKKRKVDIMAGSRSNGSATINNHIESENDETGVDTPRTDTADSPCEGAAAASAGVPVTDVTEKGDPVEGDKSSVSKHLCRNCGIDPIESHPESKPDIRPHPQQQALVERRSITNICAKCRTHWLKYAELPRMPEEEIVLSSVPTEAPPEAQSSGSVKVDTEAGAALERAGASSAVAFAEGIQQSQDGVFSVENQRRTKRRRREDGEDEVPPASVCSFCEVYSPTYASCWPSPLVKSENVPLDNPAVPVMVIESVSPAAQEGGHEDTLSIVKEQEPIQDVVSVSKSSSLPRNWASSPQPPAPPPSLTMNPSSAANADLVGTPPLPQVSIPPPLPILQQQQLLQQSTAFPHQQRRFPEYSAPTPPFPATTGFNLPLDNIQMQQLMQQILIKSFAEASLQQQQQQQQQQQMQQLQLQQQQHPMELTAKHSRASSSSNPAVAHHPGMSHEEIIASLVKQHQQQSIEQPLNLKGTPRSTVPTSTTTHSRGTFYPPTGVPPSTGQAAAASAAATAASVVSRQQSSNSTRGSSGGSSSGSRYSSAPGLRQAQQPQPAPLLLPPFAHRPETVPSDLPFINAFVKDQLLASSMVRPANFQQHQQRHVHERQQQQQQQQQASRSASSSTSSENLGYFCNPREMNALMMERMGEIWASLYGGAPSSSSKKPSLPTPQQQQQSMSSRDGHLVSPPASQTQQQTKMQQHDLFTRLMQGTASPEEQEWMAGVMSKMRQQEQQQHQQQQQRVAAAAAAAAAMKNSVLPTFQQHLHSLHQQQQQHQQRQQRMPQHSPIVSPPSQSGQHSGTPPFMLQHSQAQASQNRQARMWPGQFPMPAYSPASNIEGHYRELMKELNESGMTNPSIAATIQQYLKLYGKLPYSSTSQEPSSVPSLPSHHHHQQQQQQQQQHPQAPAQQQHQHRSHGASTLPLLQQQQPLSNVPHSVALAAAAAAAAAAVSTSKMAAAMANAMNQPEFFNELMRLVEQNQQPSNPNVNPSHQHRQQQQ